MAPPVRATSATDSAVVLAAAPLPATRTLAPTVLVRVAGSRKRMSLVAAVAGAAVLIVGAYLAVPRSGQLAINVSDAKGAAVGHLQIFVDGKKLCEESPCIQDVGAGFHEVKVSSDGYNQPAAQVVAVGSGKAATAAFTLFPAAKPSDVAATTPAAAPVDSPRPAAAAPVAVDTTPDKSTTTTPAVEPKPAAKPAGGGAAPAVAKPPPATAGGEGFLNINSIPPSTCFLDGRSLGTTPRVHISVPSGRHVVKFVNADQGLTKTVTVTVGAGETKPAIARLE